MDSEQDKDKAERWNLQSIEDAPMPLEDLENIVMNGITKCGGLMCPSAHFCGEDSCRCIRSIFPHPYYYELYLELRDIKLKTEGLLDLIKLGVLNETRKYTKECKTLG